MFSASGGGIQNYDVVDQKLHNWIYNSSDQDDYHLRMNSH